MGPGKRSLRLGPAALALAAAMALVLSCAPKDRIKKRVPGVKPPPPSRGYLKSARPYTIMGVTYYPLEDAYGYNRAGVASWYGKKFHGRKTSSGEVYDMHQMTAAHKTLPLQTMVEVTRLDTGGKIVLRVNDRGPFVANRIIDLSYAAARKLDMVNEGTARVRVVALAKGKPGAGGGPPVAAEPPPDFRTGRFWVQVGAFGVRANAERLRERLGFPHERIRLSPFVSHEGPTLTRVRVGPFEDIAQADQALAAAARQGFAAAFVVAD